MRKINWIMVGFIVFCASFVLRAERQIQYADASRFRYDGVDRDDSAYVQRTFAWFADDGVKASSFSLVLPRNADRLIETDAGEDYVRPVELIMAEYLRKPFMHLWSSGFPVSNWPSPETLPYTRRVGKFRDGDDELTVYAVSQEEVAGKPMTYEKDLDFDEVLLYAREVPDVKGSRMRVTDMVARKSLPDGAALERALEALRKYWTSCPGSKVIGNLLNERVTPEITRQNLLVWEDRRKGVFAHWEKVDKAKADVGGIVLYMIVTDKWGFKGGVNKRVHENPDATATGTESLSEVLVRGARENDKDLVSKVLSKGVDPNRPVKRNITPLGAAVDGQVIPDVEILRLLLEAGADPNRKWGNCGTTPFYTLVQSSCWGKKSPDEVLGYSECIRLMLRHGADPNRKQGMFGYSPLNYAVKNGADLSLIKILVEEGKGVVTDQTIKNTKANSELFAYLSTKLSNRPKEPTESKKLPFLWCMPDFDRGTVERRVEEANFSVKTVTYWDEKPAVNDLGTDHFEKHATYRFMGPGKTQWLAVEYMRLNDNMPVAKDISTWVQGSLALAGKLILMEPDGIEFKLLSLMRVPYIDSKFMKKHKADMMSSHLGTIKIGETYHRVYIVCLNRGRESWKIVNVLPVHPPKGCTEKEACRFSSLDMMTGGLFIGNFKILSDKKLPACPNR